MAGESGQISNVDWHGGEDESRSRHRADVKTGLRLINEAGKKKEHIFLIGK
jgi:hypothetical protein